MSNEYWVLCDPHSKTQTEKLSTEDMQFSLLKLKTREINLYLIWKNDWPQWKKLKDFLNSDDSPFMSTFQNSAEDAVEANPKSSIKMKPADDETVRQIQSSFSTVQIEEVDLKNILSSPTGAQFDVEQLVSTEAVKANLSFKGLDKSNALGHGRSTDKMHKIELLLIHSKGTMFRTVAYDISLSGTFSEKIIPEEYHHDIFDLIIINNFISDEAYKRLTVKAQLVTTSSSVYIQYIQLNDQMKNSLRAVLEYYVRAQKKIATSV